MHIEPPRPATKAPAERFTGDVWVTPIAQPDAQGQRAVVARVHFSPGSRTAWHTHPLGQTLHVTAGIARVQSRGGEIVEAHPGQTIVTPPGEEHWHGAAPDHFMEHLAIVNTAADGSSATWLEHVTEQDYAGQ